MDRAQLPPLWIGKSGIRCQEVSRKPRIGLVALPSYALAVRTAFVAHVFFRQQIGNRPAYKSAAFAAQKMAQSLICAQNPELAIMHENRISDGVEGICPLLLHRRHLLEQPHIL